MKYKVHPHSEVQSKDIGEGTMIWQYCVVLKGAKIGRNCNINFNVFIENDVLIGNNVTIKPGAQIWDGLRIKDNVFIGPNVTFTNDLVPRAKQYPDHFAKTIINEGASIGANATIIAGVTIGQFAMIGAGSIITKDIPAFNLWYGCPARHRGYVTKNGKLVNLDFVDKDSNKYKLVNNEPILE